VKRNRPRRLTPITGIAALALCSVLAGCGATYTKRDFIARANAICASALQQARSIPPPSVGGSAGQTDRALGAYLARLLRVVQTEVRQLRSLPRPTGAARDRTTLERWLEALGQDLGSYRALATAAQRKDSAAVASAEGALRASRADVLAARYGMNACASPGGTVGSGV
jgi:hypothetical protein